MYAIRSYYESVAGMARIAEIDEIERRLAELEAMSDGDR